MRGFFPLITFMSLEDLLYITLICYFRTLLEHQYKTLPNSLSIHPHECWRSLSFYEMFSRLLLCPSMFFWLRKCLISSQCVAPRHGFLSSLLQKLFYLLSRFQSYLDLCPAFSLSLLTPSFILWYSICYSV